MHTRLQIVITFIHVKWSENFEIFSEYEKDFFFHTYLECSVFVLQMTLYIFDRLSLPVSVCRLYQFLFTLTPLVQYIPVSSLSLRCSKPAFTINSEAINVHCLANGHAMAHMFGCWPLTSKA
jgi:hypothetical protein